MDINTNRIYSTDAQECAGHPVHPEVVGSAEDLLDAASGATAPRECRRYAPGSRLQKVRS